MLSKFLDQLRKLNLPVGKYAIFGSGPLAIRGIREINDLDLIVKPDLYKELSKKYPPKNKKIVIGDIEIYQDWKSWIENTDEIIDTAEIIDGLPYIRLELVLKWKKAYGREKDLKDINLINQFLKDHYQ